MAKSEERPQRSDLSKPQAPQVFKDPVCGMEVSTDKSYRETHRDREFRFCSLSCLEKFKADPEAFVQR